ncbi:Cytochrome P450 monooxygenase CLM2 [Cladobotryum mycophilum]|uniref:Cytochrome P450 monooxygenase CLM2 n=1 Tax=Cladobotryum mycophilum TaxID=491253 RepID=A0ABR0SHL0_9HYPO
MVHILVTQAAIALVGYLVYRLLFLKKSRPNLPPGPKPLPIIGNVFDLPGKDAVEHEHWLSHRKYGPITSITVLNQPIIIIHDRHAAHEILEKKSSKTSGRPLLEFSSVSGFGRFTHMLQYDGKFRQHRKYMHQLLGAKQSVTKFFASQELEARRLLLRVLDNPNEIKEHIRTAAGSSILKIVYGYTIEHDKPDPLVTIIEQSTANFDASIVPFARAFDFWPALFKRLPEGLPGTGFKKTARRYDRWLRGQVDVPYQFVQRQMEKGVNVPSYVSGLIESAERGKKVSDEDEEDRKYSAGTLYGGGGDTTVTLLHSFILAMVRHPEVVQKAQEEIDRVTGGTRLPGVEDMNKLPYIEAVTSEALRWAPVAPMGFPHKVDEDIIYDGYLIPKGSYVFATIWWFTHDPDTYANPDAFDPERYLEPRSEPDPRFAVFGYGRRECPAKHLASSNIFLTIASLLAAFNIDKALDADGHEITPEVKPKRGFITYVEDFPFRITPRSERHVEMIKRTERDHPWGESDAEQLEWPDKLLQGIRDYAGPLVEPKEVAV